MTLTFHIINVTSLIKHPLLIYGIHSFHVTSYQANIANHHTCNHHVGFLFSQSGIEKQNKNVPNCSFRSIPYYNAKLRLCDKNIATLLGENLQFCCEVYNFIDPKEQRIFFSPYAICWTKGNQGVGKFLRISRRTDPLIMVLLLFTIVAPR